MRKRVNTAVDISHEFSVIQPIVSGDPNLKQDLLDNVKNSANANLVDYNDLPAQDIVNEINETTNRDIEIIICDEIPKNLSAKVYKQNLALKFCRKYIAAIDDDTVIDFKALCSIKELLDNKQKECIVTGIPYYSRYNNFFSRLVTGFVNSNSLLTYLPMSRLGMNDTLNGMCYFAKTDLMNKYRVFESVQDKLCDDHEIAKLMQCSDVQIIQHTIACRVGTTILGAGHYFSLMKRWMVCTNRYVREKISMQLLFLIEAGRYNNILIVSADVPSKAINPKQKESYELFSDAAAAFVITKDKECKSGILHSLQRTWIEGAHDTEIRGGLTNLHPQNYCENTKEEYMFDMKGRKVLYLAGAKVSELIGEFSKQSGIDINDVDLIILHQASKALDMLMKKMGIGKDKYINNVQKYGNMVSAPVPYVLCEAVEEGKVKRGDTVLLLGTAAGLTGNIMALKY